MNEWNKIIPQLGAHHYVIKERKIRVKSGVYGWRFSRI